MTYFVETNIFLRFLTKDNPKQYQKTFLLLKKAQQGEIKLITSSLVIFEIIWTLLSYYELPKEQVIERVISILEFPSLKVEYREIFLETLLVWQETNIDFNDAYNYVWARKQKITSIYSYDKHFDKLPNIQRKEP